MKKNERYSFKPQLIFLLCFYFFSLHKKSLQTCVLPGPTLPRPLISLMDDLVVLLLLLPLVVVPEVLWLWLCRSVWDCVELNKALIVASWLVIGLETWFLEGTIVGGPGLRWINGREEKCCESVFCCSMRRQKYKNEKICNQRCNTNMCRGNTWARLHLTPTIWFSCLIIWYARWNVSTIQWISVTYPSGKEPSESVWKRGAKLGKWLVKLSGYHNQVDHSDLLLQAWA